MKFNLSKLNPRGQTLVEVSIGAGLLTFILGSAITLSNSSIKFGNQALLKSMANNYAQEGLEAVRSMRENVFSGFDYGLSLGDNWDWSKLEPTVEPLLLSESVGHSACGSRNAICDKIFENPVSVSDRKNFKYLIFRPKEKIIGGEKEFYWDWEVPGGCVDCFSGKLPFSGEKMILNVATGEYELDITNKDEWLFTRKIAIAALEKNYLLRNPREIRVLSKNAYNSLDKKDIILLVASRVEWTDVATNSIQSTTAYTILTNWRE